jgi:hypothetical protein
VQNEHLKAWQLRWTVVNAAVFQLVVEARCRLGGGTFVARLPAVDEQGILLAVPAMDHRLSQTSELGSDIGGTDDASAMSALSTRGVGNELFDKYITHAADKGMDPETVFEAEYVAADESTLADWQPALVRLMAAPHNVAMMAIGRQQLRLNHDTLLVEQAKWEDSSVRYKQLKDDSKCCWSLGTVLYSPAPYIIFLSMWSPECLAEETLAVSFAQVGAALQLAQGNYDAIQHKYLTTKGLREVYENRERHCASRATKSNFFLHLMASILNFKPDVYPHLFWSGSTDIMVVRRELGCEDWEHVLELSRDEVMHKLHILELKHYATNAYFIGLWKCPPRGTTFSQWNTDHPAYAKLLTGKGTQAVLRKRLANYLGLELGLLAQSPPISLSGVPLDLLFEALREHGYEPTQVIHGNNDGNQTEQSADLKG